MDALEGDHQPTPAGPRLKRFDLSGGLQDAYQVTDTKKFSGDST
jgi:hypothetical protein